MTPAKARALVVAYTADGDELMATRTYVENRLSYREYLAAVVEGRRLRDLKEGDQ